MRAGQWRAGRMGMGAVERAEGWAQTACQAAGRAESMAGHTDGLTTFCGKVGHKKWSLKVGHFWRQVPVSVEGRP